MQRQKKFRKPARNKRLHMTAGPAGAEGSSLSGMSEFAGFPSSSKSLTRTLPKQKKGESLQ